MAADADLAIVPCVVAVPRPWREPHLQAIPADLITKP